MDNREDFLEGDEHEGTKEMPNLDISKAKKDINAKPTKIKGDKGFDGAY